MRDEVRDRAESGSLLALVNPLQGTASHFGFSQGKLVCLLFPLSTSTRAARA